MDYQGTLAKLVRFSGVALHSGKVVELEVSPARANSGIYFQRTDTLEALPVSATVQNISSTDLSTSIGSGSSRVSTIEHLMAAFAGLGIDNAVVRVSGPELPILDGSSAPFVNRFLSVGIVKQGVKRRLFIVKKPFEVRRGDKFLRVEPASKTRYHCSIDFNSSVIGQQAFDFQLNRNSFIKLCEARTFCHLNEVNAMRSVGLALGGSLENAVVVTDSEVLNSEGLRGHDEFVRHKLLDAIGDLALFGGTILGKITLHKSGHGLHAEFMNELMKHRFEVLAVIDPSASPEASSREDMPMAATVYG